MSDTLMPGSGEDMLQRETEKYVRYLVRYSPDALAILGRRGILLFASPAIQTIVGGGPEEITGTSIYDHVHPEDTEQIKEMLTQAQVKRGTPVEFRLRHNDGSWRHIEAVAARPPTDAEVDGMVVGFRDVTERTRAERLMRLQQRALAATSNAFVISDASQPDNPIVYVNPHFERMTGYAVEEVLGRNCRFLQGTDRYQPALEELRAAVQEGRDCRIVLRNYKKDETLFWNELYISPIRDGEGRVTNYIGVQNDVTRHRTARNAAPLFAERLSPRELDVLQLLSQGKTNRDIAYSLTISVSTVKIHVEHILTKLRARDRTEAAVRAAEIGLLPPD